MVGQTKKSFIEEQLPVSKLSCESYKERMAGSGQTLTGLGKWWGRKPLVLVRAVILGCLLPATDNPKRDRDIFLKLMTMDGNGKGCRNHGFCSKCRDNKLYATTKELEKVKYQEDKD